MKILFDLFPILLFFVAYKVADIYVATGVAILASVAQIGWLKLRGRPIEVMQWVSLGIIVVFGGMTLVFHDETFIKWKPTVLYALFAGALAVGRAFFGRNLIKSVMGAQLSTNCRACRSSSPIVTVRPVTLPRCAMASCQGWVAVSPRPAASQAV